MARLDERRQRTARAEPGVPTIPVVNWLGLKTLYLKEVRRFFKVQLQTIWAPAINIMLFLAIFSVALGRGERTLLGVPFNDFLAPGLIVMGMMQNSFANTSSSILVSKVQGTMVDVLMPPLSAGELLFSYVAGAMTRAALVGATTFGAMLLWPDVHVRLHSIWPILYFGAMGSAMLALMGILTGIWAEKFDHAAAITNFIVQPLTLLSGTFFTVDLLAEAWAPVAALNPFFYAIDGFRLGFIGAADGSTTTGAVVLLAIVVILWALCFRLLRTGWKLKA